MGGFSNACSSLDEYTDAVTSCTSFCEDLCVPPEKCMKFGNNKPRFCKLVKVKIVEKYEAFKIGYMAKYKQAKSGLRREIRRAKAWYRNRIGAEFASNNSRDVWQGLQDVTRHKPKAAARIDAMPGLTDELNKLYCRFEDNNPSPGFRLSLPYDPALATPPFSIQEQEVRHLFMKQNTRKASGPDGVSTHALRSCAAQLAPVFTNIFNCSLRQHVVLGALNPLLLCLSLKRRKPSS